MVVVAASLLLLDRSGARPPAAAEGGAAPSGAWICPHGGGEGFVVAVFLANPGSTPVTARVTALTDRSPGDASTVEVPAGTTVRVPVLAAGRGSGTYVEYFGGWIGAGWVATTGDPAESLAAEPCASEAGTRWFVLDGSTQLDEDAYVVVTNPFDAPAVLDVVVHSPDRAPVRASEWTDLVVRPRRSVALHLNRQVEGEVVAAAEIVVSVGRVAAASLEVTSETRVRSALGTTGSTTVGLLPEIGGSGQAELLVLSVTDETIRFGATALTEDLPRPAGGLTEQDLPPLSARAYPVEAGSGPTTIRAFTLDGARTVAALRVLGPQDDMGATAGANAGAGAWVVLPAVAGCGGAPALGLAHHGARDAGVPLRILPREGAAAAADVTMDVPAHGAAAVPEAFLTSAPGSAVLVRATAPVVALGAASVVPDGRRGAGGAYALSMGVSVPQAR